MPMTEKDIFRAFEINDQKIMGLFYNKNYARFITYFKTKYHKSEDYLADLYIEAYEALWNNIHIGKFTASMLQSSMYSYMSGIADNMLKAGDRKNRELFKVNMFYKDAESEDESLDLAVQKQLIDKIDQDESDAKRAELQDFVTRAVADMQPPCNELLRNFYWNRMSGDEIAEEMNYSNADSVKTQKNKCMNKLKPIVQQFRRL